MRFTSNKHLLLAGILLATLVAKAPIINNGLINRDDPAYITENPLVREFSPGGIVRIFATPDYMADYHPVTLSFFSLEYTFFGENPRGYHTVSVVLHLIITASVFFFIERLTGNVPVAAVTAALFGVHPAQVESVAWASEQKDLLYGLLYLGSLLAYLTYAKEGNSPKAYTLSLSLFILALLSKMMAAPLAIVLPLIDLFLGHRWTRKMWLEKIPFFAAALLFGALELFAHRGIGKMLEDVSYGFGSRIVLASHAALGYLFKLLLPVNLSAYYPFPFPPGEMPASELLFPLGVLLLTGICAYTFRNNRATVFGGVFFLLNIALLLQLVPAIGAFMADRYTYVASIGVFIIVAYGINYVAATYRTYRVAVWLVTGTLVVALTVASWERSGVWRDSETLWSDVINQFPDVAFMYVYRANARPVPSELAAAEADLRRAISLDPNLGIAYYSGAYLASSRGDNASAVAMYSKAIELRYQQVKSYSNRGSSFSALGKYREAISDYTSAISIDSSYADAYFNRGNIHLTLSEFPEAIRDYDAVIALNPSDGETYYNRGLAKIRSGATMLACEDLARSNELRFARAADAIAQYCR